MVGDTVYRFYSVSNRVDGPGSEQNCRFSAYLALKT